MLYVRALIYSLALQILAYFWGASQFGPLGGFRYVLLTIWYLIFLPKLLATLVMNRIGISLSAQEPLSWAVQFGVWFGIFYLILFLRLQLKQKN